LIVLPYSGQAQEEAQGEQGETATQQQPAQTLPIPLPVDIIEDEAAAEARKHREAEARQNEEDDLVAQQGMNRATQAMNEATQRMALYSLISTGLVALGTALLIVTLWLTRQANRAAQTAVDVTRDIGQRQIRAYVVVDTAIDWQEAYFGRVDNITGYNFTIKWKNCGMTPARRCHCRTSLEVFDGVIPRDFAYPDKAAPDITETNHFGPGQTFASRVGGLSVPDAIAVERGKKHVYVWSWVEYDDIFGNTRRRTEVCFDFRISEGRKTCVPTIVGPFNGADEDCHHKTKT
jgi:hypothetical protein